MTTDDRAVRALTDVVAVREVAPGMAEVVTVTDVYTVDARGEGCTCPDKEYNLAPGEKCKHHLAAQLAFSDDLPSGVTPVESFTERAVADGGERPPDCDCSPDPENDLECWPCRRDGFETPNPEKREASA